MAGNGSLVFASGESIRGTIIGEHLVASGELVFTTAMVGYSESLTDPSYFGQILVFAYPLIGNYGIPPAQHPDTSLPRGFESNGICASCVIVSSDSKAPSHWSSKESLDAWLKRQRVCGLTDVDTRMLVKMIRGQKVRLAKLVPDAPTGSRKLGLTNFSPPDGFFDPIATNVVQQVSTKNIKEYGSGSPCIGLLDCGVKHNIIRELVACGCTVKQLPWDTRLESVDCDGWLISNGPGNPVKTGDLVERLKKLLTETRPILGICLGHQLLALAAGGQVTRMGYGHRSHNQPVLEIGSKKGYITCQNHGFELDREALPSTWHPWFLNANDGSIEGIQHESGRFQGVQFHPESAGGPRDTSWIIKDFVTKVREHRS